jgi:hydroxymethylpyrimidine/phosphomethylpyrimidine kinase
VLLPLQALETLKSHLFSLATLVTPNLPEVGALLGRPVSQNMQDMEAAARELLKLGPKAILIKGGHASGKRADDLFFDGESFRVFSAPRVETTSTHGTGCTLSSAIAAQLAHGRSLCEAIQEAKEFVTAALKNALPLGHGFGPLHHFHEFYSASSVSRDAAREKKSPRDRGKC